MGFIQLPQPKRIRVRLKNTLRLRKAQADHKAWLKEKGLDNVKPPKDRGTLTFPEIEDRQGVPLGNRIPVSEKGVGNKKETMVYSGERKLLGIGMMHKSNMVPIFDEESAKEISKMRRN